MNIKEIDRLKKFADEGSAAHQHKYAKILYWGNFCKKDIPLAIEYYKKSAAQGFELAISGLQRAEDDGHKDAEEALKQMKND